MVLSLAEIATLVGGTVVGDAKCEIRGAATLFDAGPGDITFVDQVAKLPKLAGTPAAAALVPTGATVETLPVVQVTDVIAAITTLVAHFHPPRVQPRVGRSTASHISGTARLASGVDVHPGATVGDDVEIGEGSTIHSGAHLMAGCKIGAGVTIYPAAVLYENTVVGDRCVIHSGAILGATGFGFKFNNGQHVLSAQLGNVVLGHDVEVGANSTIDRGTYGPTVIGDGTKIDNQVQIAHNCHLGKHNLICSQVGIAGSTSTGDYVVMAGQVGVRDHVHIGTKSILGAKCGVSNDVPDGVTMLGTPAILERDQKVLFASIAKLPELRKQIKVMQAAVNQLQAATGGTQEAA